MYLELSEEQEKMKKKEKYVLKENRNKKCVLMDDLILVKT